MKDLPVEKIIPFLFILAAFPHEAVSRSPVRLEGRTVRVHDGDTIHILAAGRRIKVRLHAIDAPELGQPFGRKSREALAAMIAAKYVRVDVRGRDVFGRTIGTVWILQRMSLPDRPATGFAREINVNEEMIRRGWAWCFRKYTHGQPDLFRRYMRLEREAREGRRGLWADPKPLPPWKWRRIRRH